MEKRDLIQDQIEQLGFFLRKLLADFIKSKSVGNENISLESVSKHLKDELDFDLQLFISLSNDEMKKYVLKYNFSAQHLDSLSHLLVEMSVAEFNHKIINQQYLTKAIELLDLNDQISNSISLDRNIKKSEIKDLLKKYKIE